MEINKVKNQNLKALKIGIRKLNSKIDCKKSKNQNKIFPHQNNP